MALRGVLRQSGPPRTPEEQTISFLNQLTLRDELVPYLREVENYRVDLLKFRQKYSGVQCKFKVGSKEHTLDVDSDTVINEILERIDARVLAIQSQML